MAGAASWDSDAPLVIAHRGASARAPENTMAAFRLAEAMGADAIELDAKLTRDGHVIIHHDRTLDRTTDGYGRVDRCSLEEIRSLDAGSHFDASFAKERIPTLREVLERLGEQILVNVELTNYAHPFDPLPNRALSIVKKLRLEERVLFSSFNPIALLTLRSAVSLNRLALLLIEREPVFVRRILENVIPHGWVHPQYDMATQGHIRSLRQRGARVSVWTVNDRSAIRACIEMGADGVITDVPDVALDILEERRSSVPAGLSI
jgi:glycerophosphoryl diester phosphodiesterase